MRVDPREVFQGTLVVVAPHMDDEVLACGGTLAQLPQKEQIHVIYATDGMKSPAPVLSWRDSISPDLGEVRRSESRRAMHFLGVPESNTHFLNLPEARLKRHARELGRALNERIRHIGPNHVLMPFRYDRHPDHLAINHALTTAHTQGLWPARLTEYFVYYRWRLLPGGDVRRYIDTRRMMEVDIASVAARKREALDFFKSQTTHFYPWQTRPILTPALLDEVCQTPELFLRYDASAPGAAVFLKAVPWIRVAHRLEPFLQRWKYRVKTVMQRGFSKVGRKTP